MEPRFCIACGNPLTTSHRGGRERPTCGACGWVAFNPAPVGVAAVIQDEHGRVLLVKRRTRFRDGMWCLPCGYLEGDEELRSGLAREIEEETGLQTHLGEIVAVHSNLDREPPFPVGIWIRATSIDGTLQADDDAEEVAFFDLDSLPEPLAFPTDMLVLEQLRSERDTPDACVSTLTAEMHAFVARKGWYEPASRRPQTPRNLAISLNLEAAEVLEHLQWNDTIADSKEWAGELADVLLYLLQLADITNVNLTAAVRAKLQHNDTRTWDQ